VVAVDTNVLLRLLVDDPQAPEQCAMARKRVGNEERVFVPFIALVETIWVLRDSYAFSKKQILEVFTRLLENERYEIANGRVFADALTSFLGANVDFADCAIHAEARRAGTGLLTFDRKLRRLKGVEVLRN
jgi:predicted nucleic-acid-binding protein